MRSTSEAVDTVWAAGELVVTSPVNGGTSSVTSRGGDPLLECSADGGIADSAGTVVLLAPIEIPPRRDRQRAMGISMRVSEPSGAQLGGVAVSGFSIAPRTRKLHLKIAAGESAAAIQTLDKRGEELAIEMGETRVAEISVTETKLGFLRKVRSYHATISAPPSEPAAAPLLAGLVRFQAMMDALHTALR